MVKTKKSFLFTLLLISAVFIISLFTIPKDASATSWGDGDVGHGGRGNWAIVYGDEWAGSGTTDAWKTFVNNQNGKYRDVANFMDTNVGSTGTGAFNGLTLSQACKRSQYIWYYTDSTLQWYTQIGNGMHPSTVPQKWDSQDYWDIFKGLSNNGWGQPGGTVIVCSGMFASPKVPITLKADSKKFLYDGNLKTVTTWKLTAGTLKTGHRAVPDVYGARREVGSGAVVFRSYKIVDGSGSDVTGQYTVTTINGTLTIVDVPQLFERCVTKGSDTITAIIQNDVSIAPGFTPSGSPGFSSMLSERENVAYDYAMSPPSQGSTKSTWSSWKSSFSRGNSDLVTNTIDFNNAGTTVAKYGGVINVTRTHHKFRADVVFCQPQEERVTGFDAETGTVYTDWFDVGEEVIESISTGDAGDDQYSYQILGVNCNKEGLARVISAHGASNFSLVDGTVSGLVKTNEKRGLSFPLGSSGETATNAFYNDGTSCKEAFKDACISDVLSSALHDAKLNIQKAPLYTHDVTKTRNDYQDNSPMYHGFPNLGDGSDTKHRLTFFRDNVDRTVRTDVWYPRNIGITGFTVDPKTSAIATKYKLYGGTPDLKITTLQPLTNVEAPTGNKITEINRIYSVSSQINKFNAKSQWASDEGKPYELGLNWNYKAGLYNTGVTSIDGYTIKAVGQKNYTSFDVYCQFKDTLGSTRAQIPQNPFLISTVSEGSLLWDNFNKSRILFTRSVTDKISN